MRCLLPTLLSALCVAACSSAPPATKVSPSEPVDEARQELASTPESAETELDFVEPPPVEESETAIAASQADERVCRREKRTGTHLAVRVCRTRSEIKQLEQESRETLESLRWSQTQGK